MTHQRENVVECGDFDTFTKTLFSKSPQPPMSCRFDIHPYDLPPQDKDNVDRFTFRLLCDVLLTGLRIKYPNKDISALSFEEQYEMKKYFNSLGFDVHLDELPKEKNKLISFKMKISTANQMHEISFSRL